MVKKIKEIKAYETIKFSTVDEEDGSEIILELFIDHTKGIYEINSDMKEYITLKGKILTLKSTIELLNHIVKIAESKLNK